CISPTVELQADSPGEDIFNGSGHLVARTINNLGSGGCKSAHQRRHKVSVLLGELHNLLRPRAELLGEVTRRCLGHAPLFDQALPIIGKISCRTYEEVIRGLGRSCGTAKEFLHSVHRVLSHGAVRGPFSAHDTYQAASGIKLDQMIAGKSLGILRSARTNQWSHPGSATDDFLRGDGMNQVAIQVTEQVVYFIACDNQLVVNTYFLFGSAYEQPSIPGNCEQDAAIFGSMNEKGVIARQNFQRQQDVDPFAEAHAWRRSGGGHLSNCVCVRPSRVNKSVRTHGEPAMRKMFLHFHRGYLSVRGFFKGGDACVIQRLSSCFGKSV